MVGAGISYPPLPLASTIQARCQEEAGTYGKTAEPSSGAPIDSYSYWFEQGYPHARDRQQFLRHLMENAVISQANFRLAHLMLEKTVTNLVVTTNFDDFLSRALALFGRHHVVCDQPGTLARIDPQSLDVQIIHIHGSYWFYDCCNLRAEISERAKSSDVTSFTMPGMLDEILRTHSPLVVGYSGWEGDVFMTALQRRLVSPLGTNLYWFCYKRRDAQTLPAWLSSNSNVCVVAPDKDAEDPSKAAGSPGDESSSSESSPDEPVLEATAVFDALIRNFNPDLPDLTKDPLGFFSNQLKTSLLGERPENFESDIYSIKGVIERLDRAREREQRLSPPLQVEALLESFRNAVRQSKHREAIQLALKIPLGELSAEHLLEISSALFTAGPALRDNSDEELSSYDLVLAIASRLEALGKSDLPIETHVARALLNKGVRLGALNRSEDAIAAYDEVVRRFGDATEPEMRERVAKALRNRGVRLGALNRTEDAIAAYDEVLRRFGDATETALRDQVAKALFNKGNSLGALNRIEDAIAAYDEVVRRFGDATESALREPVGMALFNKGDSLGALNRSEDAIAAYDEVLRRFGNATEPTLRKQVVKALFKKGVSLGDLNRSEEAISAYDEVLRRVGDASEPALDEAVARALVNKGVSLAALNRAEEAIAAYDEVLRQFYDATAPALREQVEKALHNKASVRAL
jgi:tetratricopeptide (TPR) repeat protein